VNHAHANSPSPSGTVNPPEHNHHAAAEPTEGEREHVPPDPPTHPLSDMSDEHMIELMQMEDNAPYSLLLVDQAEWRGGDGLDAFTWDAQGFYGSDYNKLWIKTEGDHTREETESSNELLWDRLIARWWSLQAGGRIDSGAGPTRGWAALGVQGLAPYWFDIEATAYFGDESRTALRISAEHDSLFTQRLVLQTKLELNAYGKDDPENAVGSGLSESELSLRLRYEFKRELAPYVGVGWAHRFGETARLVREEGQDANELKWIAGLRVWF
jgi:copper resistance protein B